MLARPFACLLGIVVLPAAALSAPSPRAPLPAPPLRTPAQLLTNLVDVLPPRPEANRRELFPVGFSTDGAFAYFSNAYYPEVEGTSWSFVVQDLVTDKQLVRLPPSGAPLVPTLEEGIAAHRAAIEAALKTHGITALARTPAVPAAADPGTPLLRPFPLFVGSSACSVDAARKPDDNFALTFRCGNHAKSLGSVWTIVAGPVATGALVSPHEARVAVIVQTATRALHGSDPMNLNYAVFGAHLDKGFEAVPTGR